MQKPIRLNSPRAHHNLGDTFGVLPPGLVNLRYFPNLHREFEATSYDAEFSFWRHSGPKIFHHGEADWNRPDLPHPARGVRVPWIERRSGVVFALEAQVRRLEIHIEYGKTVVSYDEDETKGFVRTDGGDTYYADVVVAADGVGTRSHEHVTGRRLRPSSSGYAAFRGMIPSKCLDGVSPDARRLYLSGKRPEFRIYLA